MPMARAGRVPPLTYGEHAKVIPHVIWTYWQDAPLPLIAQACLSSWQRHLPAYRIELLGPGNLPTGLPSLPTGFATWSAQVQSDWVRLAVLAAHGGVWMDATTLVTCPSFAVLSEGMRQSSPLSFVEALDAHDQPDLIGYFNQERTHNPAYPMVENWFLATPAGNLFMQHWWKTFDAMLTPDGRCDIGLVAKAVTLPDLLQGFDHAPEYFGCHAAAQWVMRKHGGCLALIPAELDAFFEPHSRGWDPERVCAWLCDAAPDGSPSPSPSPSTRPITKLIGLLWRPLEVRFQRGDVHPESILGKLCATWPI